MTRLDLEEILRRELHAAAESIEPAADGLNQIRARLSAPRPLAFAWLMVGWTSVGQPALLRVDQVLVAFADWLRAMLRPVLEPLHPVAEWLRPVTRAMQPALSKVRAVFTPRTESGARPSRYAWLRPALAMAAVVAVAVAGGFALSGLPRQIQQAASSMLSNPPHAAKGGQGGSGVAGSGQPSPTPGISRPSPSPSASCSPTPKPSSTPKPTPKPTPTPTPTPTPSTSPSPTPSASPSPTDTGGGDDPTTSAAGGQSAKDTSYVILASAIRPSSVTKSHPTPSASCTPGSS
jgi:hypothetical protein